MNKPYIVANKFSGSFHQRVSERWGESIFRQVFEIEDFSQSVDPTIGDTHHKQAKQIRGTEYYQTLPLLPIHDINMFPPPDEHPIVFEEVYV